MQPVSFQFALSANVQTTLPGVAVCSDLQHRYSMLLDVDLSGCMSLSVSQVVLGHSVQSFT